MNEFFKQRRSSTIEIQTCKTDLSKKSEGKPIQKYDPITICISVASHDTQRYAFDHGNGTRFACIVSVELEGTERAWSSKQLTMITTLPLAQDKWLWRAICSCSKQ
jgi:hypothetical protein